MRLAARGRDKPQSAAVGPETKERARRIGTAFVNEARVTTCPHCKSVLFVRSGKCEECGRKVTPPPLQRIVFDQWPLKRLHVRHIVNDIQFMAGYRYYQHWYASGLSPYGSIDLASIGHRSDPNVGMAASIRQAEHRKMYRQGEEALGKEFSHYVNAIVLQEQDPEQVGKRFTGRGDKEQARAVAIEYLKDGLNRLAKKYGL